MFFNFLLVTDMYFYTIVIREDAWYNFSLLNLVAKHVVYPKNCSACNWENCIGVKCFNMSINQFGLMCHWRLLFSCRFSVWKMYPLIPTNTARGFPFLPNTRLYIYIYVWFLLTYWWWPFWQVWDDNLLWFWFAFLW